MLAGGSALGTVLLTGCLGDADETDDGDDAEDSADDDDDPVADDDAADPGDDDTGDLERHDVAPAWPSGEPLPGDAQYNNWGTDPQAGWIGRHANFALVDRSYESTELVGVIAESFSYEPGMAQIDLHDDFYWWSGDVLNADDVMTYMSLMDYVAGGDDLDAYPEITVAEQTGEFSLRFALADTWRKDWAFESALLFGINSDRYWNERWLDQFDDTGGDVDAIEEVREDIADYRIEDDEWLVHQYHIPFELRLDGSIGDIGENYWEFELVSEMDGTVRHFADEINFTRFRSYAYEETDVVRSEKFLEEEIPAVHARYFDNPEQVDFETWTWNRFREDHGELFGWNFNFEHHPSDNPHYRRAWAYMTDRTRWEAPNQFVMEEVGPFTSDDVLHDMVSADVIDAFSDYVVQETDWDQAEAEMERGGFERNGDGAWIMQNAGGDQDAGEAISMTVGSHSWGDDAGVCEMGSDFYADMASFGIELECMLEGPDPWRVQAHYHGGLLPEEAFESIFGERGLGWGQAANNNVGESVMAPEIGDTDAPQEDWVEYDTRAVTDRLAVIEDDEQYQAAVDELAWVYNQTLPRFQVIANGTPYLMNDHRWHLERPEDRPELYYWYPDRQTYFNGILSYVPENDR